MLLEKAKVNVCYRKDYVAHDWHRLVDKLAISIQRFCTFFFSAKSWFFTGATFLLLGLWTL